MVFFNNIHMQYDIMFYSFKPQVVFNRLYTLSRELIHQKTFKVNKVSLVICMLRFSCLLSVMFFFNHKPFTIQIDPHTYENDTEDNLQKFMVLTFDLLFLSKMGLFKPLGLQIQKLVTKAQILYTQTELQTNGLTSLDNLEIL